MFDWIKRAFGNSKPEHRPKQEPEPEFRPAKLPPRRSEQTQTVTGSSALPAASVKGVPSVGTNKKTDFHEDGPSMLKLYKSTNGQLHYHEAWHNQGVITEHWGVIGEKGQTRDHRVPRGSRAGAEVQRILHPSVENGFAPIEMENHAVLLIEFAVEGFGTSRDLTKRHALEDRMGELLGWTGLGDCDGGSIGSGTMEVCCYVVDFNVAKRVVEADLKGTEYQDYTRVYLENDDAS